MIKKSTKNSAPKGEYLRVSPDKPSKKILTKAAKTLEAGGIIIYPTDTLYGFGTLLDSEGSIEKINEIKKREKGKPSSIMVKDRDQAELIVGTMPETERRKFDLLLPGKITVVVNARQKIEVPGFEDYEKIGFRIPDTVFCQELVKLTSHPISSSSVNLAGKKNLINMRDIRRNFQHKVDLVLDGGAVKSIKGSSVIDISSSPPTLLREGEISREVLEKMISTKIKSTINRKYTITFVCSGNICRSPMAEGILKKKLDIDALKGKVEIDSAGTLRLPSSVASLKAVEVAADHGVNIENHLSRPVSRAIVDHANMILCLAENHYEYFTKNYPADKEKIHLLKGFDNSGKFTGLSIDDPIGQSEEFYRRIYNEINMEIDRILPALIKNIIKYVYPF